MPIHTSMVPIGEIPLCMYADRQPSQQNQSDCFDAREKHFYLLIIYKFSMRST